MLKLSISKLSTGRHLCRTLYTTNKLHIDNFDECDFRMLKSLQMTAMKRGRGGRSSFNGIVATIFGCSGFVGRYVCNLLGKNGTQMILPYRGEHMDVIRLKVCGDLGQVLFHFYNLKDEKSIFKAVKYSNVVINLVGRDFETKNYKFREVHIDGAARIAKVAKAAGVERFIHVSALNGTAMPKPYLLPRGSEYLRTKFFSEQAVLDYFPDATIIRPADIYGPEDRFLRYYAHRWRRQVRAVPLWKKGEYSVKQPVYVGDVARAIVKCVEDPDTAGKIYQAVGPKRYLLSELVDWFYHLMRKDEKWWGYRRCDMSKYPTFLLKVKLTSLICPYTPMGELHMERIERECFTDSVQCDLPTLEDLDVTPTDMEDQVPWELRPYRALLYYDADLGEFEKPDPPRPICKKEEEQLFGH